MNDIFSYKSKIYRLIRNIIKRNHPAFKYKEGEMIWFENGFDRKTKILYPFSLINREMLNHFYKTQIIKNK